MVERECKQCGEIFDFKGGSLLCSDKCQDDHKAERTRIYGLGKKWETRIKTASRNTHREMAGAKVEWSDETFVNRWVDYFVEEVQKRDAHHLDELFHYGPMAYNIMPESIFDAVCERLEVSE